MDLQSIALGHLATAPYRQFGCSNWRTNSIVPLLSDSRRANFRSIPKNPQHSWTLDNDPGSHNLQTLCRLPKAKGIEANTKRQSTNRDTACGLVLAAEMGINRLEIPVLNRKTSMSDLPKVAGRAPQKVQLEAGKNYAFCTCGLSDGQPFCNGAHKGTEYRPNVFTAEKDEEMWMCLCKHTDNAPKCDGSHKTLPE